MAAGINDGNGDDISKSVCEADGPSESIDMSEESESADEDEDKVASGCERAGERNATREDEDDEDINSPLAILVGDTGVVGLLWWAECETAGLDEG
jgi:hypothetical protein